MRNISSQPKVWWNEFSSVSWRLAIKYYNRQAVSYFKKWGKRTIVTDPEKPPQIIEQRKVVLILRSSVKHPCLYTWGFLTFQLVFRFLPRTTCPVDIVPGAILRPAHTATCGSALSCCAHGRVYLFSLRAPKNAAVRTTSTVSVLPGSFADGGVFKRWKPGFDFTD